MNMKQAALRGAFVVQLGSRLADNRNSPSLPPPSTLDVCPCGKVLSTLCKNSPYDSASVPAGCVQSHLDRYAQTSLMCFLQMQMPA